MRKIVSIIAILLSVLCMFPIGLSAVEIEQLVIWSDTDGDGYEEYTDSLGNVWITIEEDGEGNRLILSKNILGVTEFEDDFDGVNPDTETVYDDYATSDLKKEMDTFYNGGDSQTKINDKVYYLAPELKAIAQPVVLPDDEVITYPTEDDPTTTYDERAFVSGATGGMSYVDESGQTTCFALSISETITYLANGVVTPGVAIPSMSAVHSTTSNYAATGEDYNKNVNNYPNLGPPHVDNPDYVEHPTNGGQGWTTRSAGRENYNVVKINSSGLTGLDYVDNNGGFRPAVWVADDSDGDGLTDQEEAEIGTNPLDADSDDDGLTDGYEVNTLFTNPKNIDSDGDKVDDFEEVNLGQDGYITDPKSIDSDGDGLDDRKEAASKTNPNNIDTDGDKVDDFEEVNLGQDGYITNPLSMDSDSDSLDDRKEASNKTNPNVPDTDNDGVLDGEEIILGINPLSPDSDNDGLLDGKEVALKTNPKSMDSDGDGVIDGEEVALGLNPLSTDSDNDGVTDGEEIALGTDPLVPDSDIIEVENDENNQEETKQENTNQEETLEETGSVPFTVFFIISVIAFLFALYTRFRNIK